MEIDGLKIDFVPPGTVAPSDLDPGEYWIDVGGRADDHVFDHHGGAGKSSARLAFEHVRQSGPVSRDEGTRFITHVRPDLDGICALWVLLQQKAAPEIERIVDTVEMHDQGFQEKGPLHGNWPVVFNLELHSSAGNDQHIEAVATGFAMLDDTLRRLSKGHSLSETAERLCSPENRGRIISQTEAFREDLARGKVIDAYVPIKNAPDTKTAARGLVLVDPTCTMIKEISRSGAYDHEMAFDLLMTSYTQPISDTATRYRHIISLNPSVGAALLGLGEALEREEQKHEETLDSPLPKGRERVPPGQGRFGWNVPSPWYDGRGHDYTIVDCPAVRIDGKVSISSCLTPAQVWAVFNRRFGSAKS